MGESIFYQFIILIPAIAFLFAVIFKGITSKVKNGKWQITKALSSGGMPSVHSAIVTSITMAIALKYGIFSDLFAICLTFTVIIIYDAINVRFEAGLHAMAINKIVGEKFKEELGHLPSEAFAGSLVGIFTAIILYMF
ncbi:MAG: divergent PAP2 family protein [Candidatus Gracilibacteria bacterium]|nr:divergent PAP2 family protein [Candidatus Gracilibacteria bacterium]